MGWDSDSDDDKFNYDEEDYDDGFTKKKDRCVPYSIACLLTRPLTYFLCYSSPTSYCLPTH